MPILRIPLSIDLVLGVPQTVIMHLVPLEVAVALQPGEELPEEILVLQVEFRVHMRRKRKVMAVASTMKDHLTLPSFASSFTIKTIFVA